MQLTSNLWTSSIIFHLSTSLTGIVQGFFTQIDIPMCGTRLVHQSVPSRIIGGRNALPGELPFQVALYNERVYYGTGTLITDRHVLTCGHCLAGMNSSSVTIWIGVHRKSLPALITRGRMQTGGIFYIHPAFERQSLANDIGIIRLRQRVVLDGFVNIICLPSRSLQPTPQALVSGYGYIEPNGPPSDFLKIVRLELLPIAQCLELLPNFNLNADTNFCTLSENKDACIGDSGGPVFQEERGRLVQIGIVSWGRGCAVRNSPGVHVSVIAYIDWILGILDLDRNG